MLTSSSADPAYRKNGFCNWKNAMEKKKAFQKHESSDSPMEAIARYKQKFGFIKRVEKC